MVDGEDFIVTARDVVAAGYCINPGLKNFAASHGFDFRTLVRDGLPASVLIRLDDALARRVLMKARERVYGA